MKDQVQLSDAVQERIASCKRVVIKVGTNVIMRDDGSAAIGLVYGLAESAVNVRNAGREVLFVSSGAIGLGANRLQLNGSPSELALKQACAAVGQSRLMSLYEDAFGKLEARTAQVLLTEDDFVDPVRYANLKNTLTKLLELGVVPIINENDTVSTIELDRPGQVASKRVFGDNDKLSALVMTKVDADLLILLSDVDGLYDRPPVEDGAKFVHEVREVNDQVVSYAGNGNERGRGGMLTKIEAARMATTAGRIAVIANGRVPGILERICAGERIGTVFLPEDQA